MDQELRELERAAQTGDTDAKRRLEEAYVRLNRGWDGQPMVSSRRGILFPWTGDHTGLDGLWEENARRGVYRWLGGQSPLLSSPSPVSIEMVYVGNGRVKCDNGCDSEGALYGGVCVKCSGSGFVKLRPYYVGRYPVTWEQYLSFCELTDRLEPDHPGFEHEGFSVYQHNELAYDPVVGITREDANAFCVWSGLRIPTDDEWVYAAGGGYDHKTWCTRCNGRRVEFMKGTIVPSAAGAATCPECRGAGYTLRRYAWGNEKPSPELAVFDSNRRARSYKTEAVAVLRMKPVPHHCAQADCGENGAKCSCRCWKCQEKHWDTPRPRGVSWCGACDMTGNVWEHATSGKLYGGSWQSRELPDLWQGHNADTSIPTNVIGFRVCLSGEDA